ncbi:MAG: hypothetical protein AAGI63_05830 [Planctomycetota bacterium]
MNRGIAFLGLAVVSLSPLFGQNEETGSVADQATHQQVGTITLEADAPMNINAFCLNKKGQIVAACGVGPGQIRIADDSGRVLKAWDIAVKPEAVNVAPDGTVLVGGEGKLFRFSADGKLLLEADSPHATALRSDTKKLREEAIAYLDRSSNSLGNMKARIEAYEQIITQLEEKEELNENEERMLEMLPKTLETFKEQYAIQEAAKKESGEEEPGISEEAIQDQIENLLKSKMRISSVSGDENNVFVATNDIVGYGFAIWKTSKDFSGGETIVSGLRGCCGQMDVQCCKNGLFVAENSRHRVVRFDASGEETTNWGGRDRTGVEGFSSCCNPMNVCFNGANEVYTAESGSGRIKKFDADGKFLSYVGDVELVPGCKNVSIAATADGEKVYMLDLTRNHIVLMKSKSLAADLAAAGE